MAEALARVKQELGDDAVILHTRTVRRGKWFGLYKQPIVEITAGTDLKIKPRAPRPRKAEPAESKPAGDVLRKAYQQGIADARRGASSVSDDRASVAPKNNGGPVVDPQMADEIRQLRKMVERFVRTPADKVRTDLPEPLFEQYLTLLEQDVSEELAEQTIDQVREQLGGDLSDRERLRQAICKSVAKMIPTGSDAASSPGPNRNGRPYTIALVGPTGVGKTTTLAKLAATFKLRDSLKVGMVTIDTYRIAAVDQLRTYAQIIGVPLHVAQSPLELKDALARCGECDVVLIDTAGRSQRDDAKLDELASFIKAVAPDQTHLVLSSAASQQVLMDAVERFSHIPADGVIFTKLDEAVTFGVVVNVMNKVKKKLSYITTGQDVPHQIEAGDSNRLAGLILGEKL